MKWVWELKDWPNFKYDSKKLLELEHKFLINSGKMNGISSHLIEQDFENIKVDILSIEAISTSNIEGELLERDSVKSSIRKHLGLKTENIKIPPNAYGVSEMMVDVYKNWQSKLTNDTLYEWHKMLMNGRRDIENIGNYRSHVEPMQIVSGNYNSPRVYFEAPHSKNVLNEMQKFIDWYNTNLSKTENYSILAFAGIVHLYFEIIHPFEDGNGRIGRALVEKAISQKLGMPSLNSLAKVIDSNKKEYYRALESGNHSLEIDNWLNYFSNKIIESQEHSIMMFEFLVSKAKFFREFDSRLNPRQKKVINKLFDAGPDGFKGGLSASNYKNICQTSTASTTRDLQDLVEMKALNKKGELKSTRYYLYV